MKLDKELYILEKHLAEALETPVLLAEYQQMVKRVRRLHDTV